MVPHRLMIFMAAMTVSAVTARAQDMLIKPRTIEPGRIIAIGEYPAPVVAVKPRTIEPGRIIAMGEYTAVVAVKPRTIALSGVAAQGSYTPAAPVVSPRTIRLTGWTASPPPKGGKK